jgi:DNA invertase Pin-like site-specific DNA recombinase
MRALESHQKVNVDHLKRNAYLYIRQSTLRQVIENTESTKRQYDLRQHAVALGWPVERIVVIDSDLGQSGASAVDREGFQRLVAEVGMGKAGIVLGLEVSRLARNSTDWHRLLEICALTDTLILDEDGIYDPAHYNDRLLLGLKGTLSEAELHVIKARLQGGILNKARRGELESALPVGFIYNPARQPVLDPDKQVQESLRFFFETFTRLGSAMATMKAFHQRGLLFPRRLRKGPQKGDLVWAELTHSRALQILHNPRYAGAFVYRRKRVRKKADGSETCLKRPRDQWILLPGAHPGYISWELYEENQRRLLENAQAQGDDRRKSPPREGPALLQGLVLCGVCGRRMTVRYHNRCTQPVPDYVCQKDGIEHGKPICQSINGEQIDKAIGGLLIQTMTPMALDIALAVQQEVQTRLDDVDRLRRKQVERARYEADQAQRRYMHVDPANRLVADTLESEWNSKLRALSEAQQEYDRLRQTDHLAIDEAQRARIAALASDFPRLWQDPKTPDREKKRMVRLLLEDVTLLKGEQIQVHIRFKGGVLKSLSLPPPLSAPYLRKTPADVVGEVDRLLNQHTDREIVAILNEKGLRSGMGRPFTVMTIINIRRHYGLQDRCQRMHDLGLLTIQEIAERLGIAASAVKDWRDRGLLRGHRYNDKGQCLYEPPANDLPAKHKRKGTYLVATGNIRTSAKGVQCEA